MQDFKYVKHGDKQKALILEGAKELFLEKAIKDVSIAAIAQKCNVMRATIYRYFENRDAIVWEIYIAYSKEASSMLAEKLRDRTVTSYERIALFFQNMVDVFERIPDYYKFFSHFSKEYLSNKLYPDTKFTRELYESTGLTSGSTVSFITSDFHDGSVKDELDAKLTGVSLIYGSLGILEILSSNRDSIPLKYGFAAEQVLKNTLRTMLTAIKNDSYISEFADALLV